MNVLSRALRLTNLSLYIYREKKSENSLRGNEQQQQQHQDSVVGSMIKKNGKISKILFCIHDELVFFLIILYKINVMKATIRKKKNFKI